MRILNPVKQNPQEEQPKAENTVENKVKKFNQLLVAELGKELYGMNFYTSLGIYFKTKGLNGIARFYWDLAQKTMYIKGLIKNHLLADEYCFTIPAIDAVREVNADSAVPYEEDRIKELYKLFDAAPCEVSSGFITDLIKKHKKIKHIVTLAQNISKNSNDMLLIQQEISKIKLI